MGTWGGIRLQTGDMSPAALDVGDCGTHSHDVALCAGAQGREEASILAHSRGCWARAIRYPYGCPRYGLSYQPASSLCCRPEALGHLYCQQPYRQHR